MRTCKCGGVIRESGKPYWDTLESCTCSNPEAVKNETYISITTTMPPNTKKCDCLHSHLACQYNNPPCHTPAVEDWEIKFEKEFRREDGLLDIGKYDDEIIKDFIRSLRESDRKRTIEAAENEKWKHECVLNGSGTSECDEAMHRQEIRENDEHNRSIDRLVAFITNIK